MNWVDFEKFVESFDGRSFYLLRIEVSRGGCITVDYAVMHGDCYDFIIDLIDCHDSKNGCQFGKMEMRILGSNCEDSKSGENFTDWTFIQFREINADKIWRDNGGNIQNRNC